ncbi:TRAP transporter small permease [Halomonas sp. BM-2019]|uniref:TRAP transporter small permease n=1 Tax=Halomonas sp. BM-2019 TaxID=2811227 RepID=UPI001B3C3865|nr:MAG: TRAP transporter small permease [Halomonas sp. BM-2019]
MTYKFALLYRLGAWGAAACMVTICVLVALQVTFRLVDALLVLVGLRRLGLGITGVSEIAGYLLVGATFLGLAYTFIHHAHIRVTLLLSRLPSRIRVWVEVWCLIVALAIGLLLGYGLVELARESLHYRDVSSGFLAIPLWIPQTVLATGVGLLCLALAETLVMTLRLAARDPDGFRELTASDDSDLP